MKLERRLARIEQAFSTLSQQIAHNHQPHGDPAGTLVAQLIDSQSKQFSSSAEFLRTINEIGIERAGAALGRRGGKRRAATARRDERGRMLPGRRPASDCELCDDPMTANFSMAVWEEHQKHKGGRRNEPERRERERDIEIEPEHVHVHEHREYPLPVVSLGDQTSGASGGDSEIAAPVQQTNGAVVS